MLRIWHALRQIEQTLNLVVERAVNLQGIGFAQTEPAREVRKVFAQRQRRGGEDPRAGPRAQQALETTRDIERQQAERVATLRNFRGTSAIERVEPRDA